MKKLLIIFLSIILFSCSSRKQEKQIVNSFINEQLLAEKYKKHKDFKIILLQEAGNGKNALSLYEKLFNNKNYPGSERINNWIIDSSEIANLKNQLNIKKECNWRKSDFKNINLSIVSTEEFKKNLKSEYYYNTKPKLFLTISKPLIVKKGYALIYFDSSNTEGIISTVEHFVVLMKKIDDRWIRDTYYYDDGKL